ncbi:golgin subfamily A member 6-like protein 22 [Drosophila elegans]|uniref:golgin subfamily A member 6-like protein 22 n=1 Tax=Drosophila elegans TaxID=30023 RepID=UPI001BC84E16|nr:golgin subfamily A member 6-like protein 22 [Drosophila elegans]
MDKYPQVREFLGLEGKTAEIMLQFEEEIKKKTKVLAEEEGIRSKLVELTLDLSLAKQGAENVKEINEVMAEAETMTYDCLFQVMQIERLLEQVGLQDILRYTVQREEQQVKRQMALEEEREAEEEQQLAILRSRDVVQEFRVVHEVLKEEEKMLTTLTHELDQLNSRYEITINDLTDKRNKKIVAIIQTSKQIAEMQAQLKSKDISTMSAQSHIKEKNVVTENETNIVSPQEAEKPSNSSSLSFQSANDFLKMFLEDDKQQVGILHSILANRNKEKTVISFNSPPKHVQFAPDPLLTEIVEFEKEEEVSGSDEELVEASDMEFEEESEEEMELSDAELDEEQPEDGLEKKEEESDEELDEEQPEDGSPEESDDEFNEEQPADGSENIWMESDEEIEDGQLKEGSENEMEESDDELNEEQPADGSENEMLELEESDESLDEVQPEDGSENEIEESDEEFNRHNPENEAQNEKEGSQKEFDEKPKKSEPKVQKSEKFKLDIDDSEQKSQSENMEFESDDDASVEQESSEEEVTDKGAKKLFGKAKPKQAEQKINKTMTQQKASFKGNFKRSFIPETPQIRSVNLTSTPKNTKNSKASKNLPSTSSGSRNRYSSSQLSSNAADVVKTELLPKRLKLDDEEFPMAQPHPSNDDHSFQFASPNSDINDDFLLNFSDDMASFPGASSSYFL